MPAVHFQKRFKESCPYAQSAAAKIVSFAAVFRTQLVALFLVARERFLDNLVRGVGRPNVFHLDLLAFELFVVLEKRFKTSSGGVEVRWPRRNC